MTDPFDLQRLLNLAAAGLLGGSALGAAWMGVQRLQTSARRKARLSGEGGPAPAPSAAPQIVKRLVGQVRNVGDQIAMQDPASLSAIRMRLIQAGFFGRQAVPFYLASRAGCLGAATIAALLLLPWAVSGGGGLAAILLACVMVLVALLGPDQFIRMRRSKLESEYRNGFPDMLDLLVASVEAGLSLDGAISRVGDELWRRYPSLTEHLRLLSLELRAGRDRKEAWRVFAERLGLEEARAFATMLRQAEEMGASVGETLRVFAEDMRTKRMLRAEEKAMALPAKLIVPLIIFIFPCLLGVLMLPAIFRVIQVFSGQGSH